MHSVSSAVVWRWLGRSTVGKETTEWLADTIHVV